MRRLKGKNVLSRGAGLIMAPIALVGYVALFFLGEIIGLIPLESIIENLENRWYRAALWAGGFVCWLVGALLIERGGDLGKRRANTGRFALCQ